LHCETASQPENQYQQNKRNTHPHPLNQPLLLNDQQIEQVSEFPYLGSRISKDNGGTNTEVAERIKKARGAFRTLNTVWKSTIYSNNTKICSALQLQNLEAYQNHHTSTPSSRQ